MIFVCCILGFSPTGTHSLLLLLLRLLFLAAPYSQGTKERISDGVRCSNKVDFSDARARKQERADEMERRRRPALIRRKDTKKGNQEKKNICENLRNLELYPHQQQRASFFSLSSFLERGVYYKKKYKNEPFLPTYLGVG